MRFTKLAVPMLALVVLLAGSARALPCLCVGDAGAMGPAHAPARHAPPEDMDGCCGGSVPVPVPAPCCGACLSEDRDHSESLISGLPLPPGQPAEVPAVEASFSRPVASPALAPVQAVFSTARAVPLFILFRSLIV